MPELQQNIVDDLASVTTESWRTFRIMAEMVEALDALNALKVKCISLFGTARCTPDSAGYKDAEKISRLLVEAGFAWPTLRDMRDKEMGLKEFLDDIEQRLLEEALQEADGVKNQAAEILGIKRTTLIEKLKKRKGGESD